MSGTSRFGVAVRSGRPTDVAMALIGLANVASEEGTTVPALIQDLAQAAQHVEGMIRAKKRGDMTGAVIHLLGAAAVCDDGYMRRMSDMLQEGKQFADAARANDKGASMGALLADRLMNAMESVEQQMAQREVEM